MNFKFNFFKGYILPLLTIFLIPVSCYYFYGAARGMEDRNFVEVITKEITTHKEITEAEKAPLIEVYKTNPTLCFLHQQ